MVFPVRCPQVAVQQLEQLWKLHTAKWKKNPTEAEKAERKSDETVVKQEWTDIRSVESAGVLSKSVPLQMFPRTTGTGDCSKLA